MGDEMPGSGDPVSGDEHEGSAELVMPFLPVRSQGGPYDDEGYATGWEMGYLVAALEYGPREKREACIHAGNAAQVDLIAMRHGYACAVTGLDEEWANVALTPGTAPRAHDIALGGDA